MKGWRGFLVGIGIMCVGRELVHAQHIMGEKMPHVLTISPTSSTVLMPSIEKNISQNIHGYDGISLQPALMQKIIIDTFPFIRSVVIQKRLGHSKISYHVYKPLIIYNDALLLLENGKSVPLNFYQEKNYKTIPSLTITEPCSNTALSKVFSFTMRLGVNFFKNYSVTWHNQHCIEIYDIQCPDITCIIDETIDELSYLSKKITYLKQEVTRLNEGRKKPLHYKADLRFAGQIVLSVQKGGKI